ncbi:hypothetical protein [Cohnella zeiphila]|uniref:Signal peptide protein n=1 Tax=Cohnella zeiphila TaxID=2761120 RepID=A0A7X0SKS8_9BACL|nr:hypothetical protein [Cohnella zeiphila]MBB6731818.1 signal peptide protein [Cohnella zeiphila]
MSQWEPRNGRNAPRQSSSRFLSVVVGGVMLVIFLAVVSRSCSSSGSDWNGSAVSREQSDTANSAPRQQQTPSATVPWDYRLVEETVGDLVGGDMKLLPDEDLLPNDDNYATGDKIWALQYMGAVMKTEEGNRADVTLTSWKAIKSYKTKEAAQGDLDKLKLSLKAEIDLVGVYKTQYQGQTREFAVLTLPSGQTIKQPVDDARYEKLKPLKKVEVMLEEVHDYGDYDMAYAKFRGWAA